MIDRLVDSGRVPEPLMRLGIRAICALRLYQERRGDSVARQRALVEQLRRSDIAIDVEAASSQHYEVPSAFFEAVLGPHLKYSSCYWPDGVSTLGDAEAAMLALTAERAGLADGQDILDLGCGWGALALWAAERFPASRIVAVSSSHAQRAFVEARARQRGLANLTVRTADVRTLELPSAGFDRVVSVEMFEHMRNYEALLGKISRWLRKDGTLFVHVFAHARHAYAYEDGGRTDWMAREFFTGGLMPSVDLLRQFQDRLRIVDEWQLPGTHYARTAEAWYGNLMRDPAAIVHLLAATYGAEARARFERWRVFFLACAELFGFRDGREWLVAHYRFVRK